MNYGFSNPGRRNNAIAYRMQQKKRKMRIFADELADGATITGAARAAGVSQQTGSLYFREICQGLGAQAC